MQAARKDTEYWARVQYSNQKAGLIRSAYDLSSKFPGTEVLVLISCSKENSYIYDFKTPGFAALVTQPDSKSLIAEYFSAPDAESSDENERLEHGTTNDGGGNHDEVPTFNFRRAGNGSMAITDKERYNMLFPQFKAHALTKGPDLVAAFATPKLLPLLTQPEALRRLHTNQHDSGRTFFKFLPFLTKPEGWKAIKARLQAPRVRESESTEITSKRIPANHRYKIEKRVKDHHRKLRKDAKNKPNAHHKNKKDPGIPNNFPGKEKILQQIADQKLKAQEEKDKQKEIRRKAAEKARKANKARNINAAEPTKEKKAKEATSTEGVLSKAAKRKAAAAASTSSPATKKTKTIKKAAAKEEEEDVDADAPYNFAEHFVSGEGDEEVEEGEEAEEEDDE
ncbi:hypothetical protein EC968_009583 [Mortierella alpina]|nr:hypothetical protein EC968_009583 [Mortierella alpina]